MQGNQVVWWKIPLGFSLVGDQAGILRINDLLANSLIRSLASFFATALLRFLQYTLASIIGIGNCFGRRFQAFSLFMIGRFERQGVSMTIVPCSPQGTLEPDKVEAAIQPKTT